MSLPEAFTTTRVPLKGASPLLRVAYRDQGKSRIPCPKQSWGGKNKLACQDMIWFEMCKSLNQNRKGTAWLNMFVAWRCYRHENTNSPVLWCLAWCLALCCSWSYCSPEIISITISLFCSLFKFREITTCLQSIVIHTTITKINILSYITVTIIYWYQPPVDGVERELNEKEKWKN